MSYGSIKTPPPQLVKAEHEVANKIANVVSPMGSGDVFDKLAATGMYTSNYSRPVSTMGTKVSNLSTLQKQLQTQTPTEMATRTGVRLPNLGRTAKRGIASSPSLSQQDTAGGVGEAATPGNTRFVDDKNWKVTLQEILGSKMLSNEQLRKASIGNVRNMIRVEGGTQQEQDEVLFMFQRMLLEGFVRGVDISADIEKNGAPVVKLYDYSALGVARHSGAKNTETVLDLPFWRRSDEMNKYMLFTHEMGHQLLNKNHYGIGHGATDGGADGIMNQRLNSEMARKMMSSKEQYNSLMNDLFSSRMSKSFSHLRSQVANNPNPHYEKDWFPSLDGFSTGYRPGAPVSGFKEVQYGHAQTINLADRQAANGGGNKGGQQTAPPTNTNPAAPVGLTEDVTAATKTFANGMADLSKAPAPAAQPVELGNISKIA